MLSAASFTALALLAVEIDTPRLVALDTSVYDWFYRHRFHQLRFDSSEVFGLIGQPIPFAAAGGISGSLLALWARSMRPAVVVTGGVAVGVAIEETLKAVVTRKVAAGPLVDYAHSFPSGHVTAVGTLLGMIAACLGIGRSRIAKATLAVLGGTGVGFVAFLAVHSGAHTFTDVIGGMVLSTALVAAGAATLRPRIPKRAKLIHRSELVHRAG